MQVYPTVAVHIQGIQGGTGNVQHLRIKGYSRPYPRCPSSSSSALDTWLCNMGCFQGLFNHFTKALVSMQGEQNKA